MDNCLHFSIESDSSSSDWILQMSTRHSRAKERAKLLRFLTKYFEQTSENARDPLSHATLLAELRCQLDELESEEAARHSRFEPLFKVVGFVFGKLRAI
jgi:hypothetical protein